MWSTSRSARIALVCTAMVVHCTVSAPLAVAADPLISNDAIYARADSYATGTGVGTCKHFVETVFNTVASSAGSSMRLADGYYRCYGAAGGEQVSLDSVVRGDIVQVYRPTDPETYYWGMHVAIVVRNRGSGVVDVIDANWSMDGRIQRHTWDLNAYLADYPSLSAVAWRLGTLPTAPEPPATTLAVHRFYNASTGTHFYTSSEDERRTVEDRWPTLFAYEGVAYRTDPSRNGLALYRFFNTATGGHFYTASAEEAQSVMARWPHLYHFDGRTYGVCLDRIERSIAVYRFYNTSNGNHFFTAQEAERNAVIAGLSGTYRYEGVAFWLAQ